MEYTFTPHNSAWGVQVGPQAWCRCSYPSRLCVFSCVSCSKLLAGQRHCLGCLVWLPTRPSELFASHALLMHFAIAACLQALLGTAQLDHLLAHDTLRTTLTPLPPSSPSMLTHASAPQPMDVFPLHPSMVGPETALAHGSEELSTLMPAAPGAVLHQPVHDNVSTRPIAISSGSGNGDCNRQKPDGVLLKSSTAAATGSVHSGMGPLVPRAHMRGHGVEVLLAPPRLGGTAGGMVPLMSSPSPAVESCGPRAYLVSLSPR